MRQLLTKQKLIITTLLLYTYTNHWAVNPIAEWQKPFPSHQLVTRSTPSTANTPKNGQVQSPPQSHTTPSILTVPQEPNYEHIVLFALQATIAAFHFNPSTFSSDQIKLKEYFDDNALNQITQALLPGSGYGLLDQCFLTQTPCDAITYQPVSIEKQSPHFLQVRLPMVLSTQEKVDIILSITPNAQQGFRVTNFVSEKVAQH